jgi:undecaprenyl-diphosphatase
MAKLVKKILAVFTLIGVELLILGIIAFGCVAIFLLMAKLVFIDNNNALDVGAFRFAESFQNPGFTSFFRFISFFASRDFLVYGSLSLAFIFFFLKKHRLYVIKIPVIAAGSSGLNQVMKFWFDRPRPSNAFFPQPGFSFPSGHAMIGGAFYGLFIYLIWTNVNSLFWRWLLSLMLFFWILLIGFSRVYLHVHYATDVLAGWSAGILFLFISLVLLRKLELRYARRVFKSMAENNNPSDQPVS